MHKCERLHGIYGPVLRIAPNKVTFADEATWADIFQHRSDKWQFLKDPLWWSRQPGQPNSLLCAIDPEEHARIRKLMAPAFTAVLLCASILTLQMHSEVLKDDVNESLPPNS